MQIIQKLEQNKYYKMQMCISYEELRRETVRTSCHSKRLPLGFHGLEERNAEQMNFTEGFLFYFLKTYNC